MAENSQTPESADDESVPKLQHKDSGHGDSLVQDEVTETDDKNNCEEPSTNTKVMIQPETNVGKMCISCQTQNTPMASGHPLENTKEYLNKPNDTDMNLPVSDCSSENYDKSSSKLQHEDSGKGKSLLNSRSPKLSGNDCDASINNDGTGIDDEKAINRETINNELSQTEKQTQKLNSPHFERDQRTEFERSCSKLDSGIEKTPPKTTSHFDFPDQTSKTKQALRQQNKVTMEGPVSGSSNQIQDSQGENETGVSFYLSERHIASLNQAGCFRSHIQQANNNAYSHGDAMNNISSSETMGSESLPTPQLVPRLTLDQMAKELEKTKLQLKKSEFMKQKLESDLFAYHSKQEHLETENKGLEVRCYQQHLTISDLHKQLEEFKQDRARLHQNFEGMKKELQAKEKELQERTKNEECLQRHCEQLKLEKSNLTRELEQTQKHHCYQIKDLEATVENEKQKVRDWQERHDWLEERIRLSENGSEKPSDMNIDHRSQVQPDVNETIFKSVFD